METPEHLLTVSIYWQRHEHNQRYFYAYRNGQLILLRINDFPDEPYCTIIMGLAIMDMEDIPVHWVIP
jgi:hypothetical protein